MNTLPTAGDEALHPEGTDARAELRLAGSDRHYLVIPLHTWRLSS